MVQRSLARSSRSLLIDVHSHYTPQRLGAIVSAQGHSESNSSEGQDEIAPSPSRATKLAFMDRHGISQSIISIPPFTSFPFGAEDAVRATLDANADLEAYCAPQSGELQDGPSSIFSPGSAKQQNSSSLGIPPKECILALAMLPPPTKGQISQHSVLDVLENVSSIESLVGVTLSTEGLGRGLGDPELEPVWGRAAELGLALFVHPPCEELRADYGTSSRSAVLDAPHQVALAASHLILFGVLDRYPALKILLSYSSGSLPLLSSRLSTLYRSDPHFSPSRKHGSLANPDPRFYLGKLHYDSLGAYGPEELHALARLIGRSDRFKVGKGGAYSTPAHGSGEEAAEVRRGGERILFGSDHPLFPPLREDMPEQGYDTPQWGSVVDGLTAVRLARGWDEETRRAVVGGNAQRLLGL